MPLSFLGSTFVLLVIIMVITKIVTKLTMGWCKSNTCLVGKTVIITGGNSGLGYQTAQILAGRGAKVIIADVADTKVAVEKIIRETDNPNITGKYLDLASLDSVRKFSEEIYRDESRLDILINNAGIAGLPLSYTKDGLQIQMQTNYFGHFLLTHLLIGLLKKSKSRIIFVSSLCAFIYDLTLENLNNPTIYYDKVITYTKIYSNSKLCELIASNMFAQKLKGTTITSNAVYPGSVITPIFETVVNKDFRAWTKKMVYLFLKICGKTAYEGAQIQINCALSKDLENVSGKFFVDCVSFFQPSPTRDKHFCKRIWEKSEELVKLTPEEKLENIL